MSVTVWNLQHTADSAVSITGTPEEEYAEPDVITFVQQDDQIVAVEYAVTLWGEAGLTLTAVAAGETQP